MNAHSFVDGASAALGNTVGSTDSMLLRWIPKLILLMAASDSPPPATAFQTALLF